MNSAPFVCPSCGSEPDDTGWCPRTGCYQTWIGKTCTNRDWRGWTFVGYCRHGHPVAAAVIHKRLREAEAATLVNDFYAECARYRRTVRGVRVGSVEISACSDCRPPTQPALF